MWNEIVTLNQLANLIRVFTASAKSCDRLIPFLLA